MWTLAMERWKQWRKFRVQYATAGRVYVLEESCFLQLQHRRPSRPVCFIRPPTMGQCTHAIFFFIKSRMQPHVFYIRNGRHKSICLLTYQYHRRGGLIVRLPLSGSRDGGARTVRTKGTAAGTRPFPRTADHRSTRRATAMTTN